MNSSRDADDDGDGTSEINFDGLVGPTHNYAGLSEGNLASTQHRDVVSHPREAALQGLAKMRALAALGVRQALVPPLERPALHVLRGLGFSGPDDETVLARAWRDAPALAAACTSASSMWTANAVTVTPSADTADGRVHFTAANLSRNFHRAIEAPDTARLWQRLFADEARFVHHAPLGGGAAFADEGAANHSRFCPGHGGDAGPGLHLFVFGGSAFRSDLSKPARFPARQTLEASQAVARRHGLGEARAMFVQQHPAAIDAGVFHNDVIATGNEGLFLVHAEAFVGGAEAITGLRRAYAALHPGEKLLCVEVSTAELSLADAVRSYLFNSQVITLPANDGMALIAPVECQANPAVAACIAGWIADAGNPIRTVRYFDLRQSMRNGGGPACLRQRVVLSAAEIAAVPGGLFLEDDAAHDRLADWVRRHYRETLSCAELASPDLLCECRAALDELTGLLGLGGAVYEFQRAGADR